MFCILHKTLRPLGLRRARALRRDLQTWGRNDVICRDTGLAGSAGSVPHRVGAVEPRWMNGGNDGSRSTPPFCLSACE